MMSFFIQFIYANWDRIQAYQRAQQAFQEAANAMSNQMELMQQTIMRML